MINALRSWRPDVDALVAFESRTHCVLINDLAAGLTRYLQVLHGGRLAIRDEAIASGRGQTNSAHRVAAVSRRYNWIADRLAGNSVLLVEDQVVTGWSLTLAARWVRQTGARAVLPSH